MSMILIGHFFTFTTQDLLPKGIYGLLNPFFSCGVNLFFLISGWFQIRFSIKSIVNLVITIFVYNIIIILLCFYLSGDFEWKIFIKEVFFPISQSTYWFIKVYLLLIITAPLINCGINNLDIKSFRIFIIAFSLFTFYSCGIGHNLCNPDGFNYVQGFYIYCLGAYLRRDNELIAKISDKWLVISYLLILTIVSICYYFSSVMYSYTYYNSFSCVTTSALLFILLSRLKFQSKFVNRLGAAALGCYLLQENRFGHRYMYKWMHDWNLTYPTTTTIALYIGVFIAIWLASLLLTSALKRVSGKAA